MPSTSIAMMIGKAVILPLAAGMLVKRLLPDLVNRLDRPSGIITNVLLTVATLILVGANLPVLWRLIGGGTLLMMAAFIIIGVFVGHLMGAPGVEHEGVLALATASRHPAIALSLANANYPGEHFGGTILLYLVVNAILCIPYIKWQKSRVLVTA
jgi:BASS family bile acid:Na+ symporter